MYYSQFVDQMKCNCNQLAVYATKWRLLYWFEVYCITFAFCYVRRLNLYTRICIRTTNKSPRAITTTETMQFNSTVWTNNGVSCCWFDFVNISKDWQMYWILCQFYLPNGQWTPIFYYTIYTFLLIAQKCVFASHTLAFYIYLKNQMQCTQFISLLT